MPLKVANLGAETRSISPSQVVNVHAFINVKKRNVCVAQFNPFASFICQMLSVLHNNNW